MIISHRKRFIFFACGKTGTTSIEKILQKYHDDEAFTKKIELKLSELRMLYSKPFNPKHARPELVKQIVGDEIWQEYYKFVFVRNPWDWVVSNFYFNFGYLGKYVEQFGVDHVNAVYHFLQLHNQIPDKASYFQHPFVVDEEGNRLVDYVGRFESLNQNFAEICKVIDIVPETIPELNVTNHKHYRELYTEPAKELVSRYYRDDIELMGYQF